MPAGSTTAVVLSTIAIQEAHEAEVSSCKAIIQSFNSHDASVKLMQDYAHCINIVYPVATSHIELLIWKSLFVIALFGMFGSVYYRWRDNGEFDIEDSIVYGLGGFVIAPCLVGITCGVLYGCYWLFQ